MGHWRTLKWVTTSLWAAKRLSGVTVEWHGSIIKGHGHVRFLKLKERKHALLARVPVQEIYLEEKP